MDKRQHLKKFHTREIWRAAQLLDSLLQEAEQQQGLAGLQGLLLPQYCPLYCVLQLAPGTTLESHLLEAHLHDLLHTSLSTPSRAPPHTQQPPSRSSLAASLPPPHPLHFTVEARQPAPPPPA